MKKMYLINIFIITMFIVWFYYGSVLALSVEEKLDLIIDVGSHVSLDIGDDIYIEVDRPWSGGELREEKTSLILQTNTDIELTWESTELIEANTGRKLPSGIPDEYDNKSFYRNSTEEVPPFGFTGVLIEKTGDKIKNSELKSSAERNGSIRSERAYEFGPGIREFEVVLKYYWSEESTWSDIKAGKYTGSIVYTISSLEE
ncbi:MAG: hypothetical protein ACOCQ5_03315 [Halanaerobiales bacterium]